MQHTKTLKEYIDKRDRPIRRALAPKELTREEQAEENAYYDTRIRLTKNQAR